MEWLTFGTLHRGHPWEIRCLAAAALVWIVKCERPGCCCFFSWVLRWEKLGCFSLISLEMLRCWLEALHTHVDAVERWSAWLLLLFCLDPENCKTWLLLLLFVNTELWNAWLFLLVRVSGSANRCYRSAWLLVLNIVDAIERWRDCCCSLTEIL